MLVGSACLSIGVQHRYKIDGYYKTNLTAAETNGSGRNPISLASGTMKSKCLKISNGVCIQSINGPELKGNG